MKSVSPAADFPVTAYDRPLLAFNNLVLRGNIDAMTRSLFAPVTLTPVEMETISRRIMRKLGTDNPIIRTALDVATNPLFLAGLVLTLAYPVAGKDVLYQLGRDAKKIAPPVNRFLAWTMPAQTIYRNAPGVASRLDDMVIEVARFKNNWGRKLNELVTRYRMKITPEEGAMVWMKIAGFDKPNTPLQKALGLKGGALAPGLDSRMSGTAKQFAADLKTMLVELEKSLPVDKKTRFKVDTEQLIKGMITGKKDDILPKMVAFDRYTLKQLKAQAGKEGQFVESIVERMAREGSLGAMIRRRISTAIPNLREMEKMEKLGVVRKGVVDEIRGAITKRAENIRNRLQTLLMHLPENAPATDAARMMNALTWELKLEKLHPSLAGEIGHTLVMARRAGADALKTELDSLTAALAVPPQYSLDALRTVQTYIQTLAPTYVWYGTNIGADITRFLKLPTRYNLTQWQRKLLQESYIPLLRQQMSWRTVGRNMAWLDTKYRMYKWVNEHPLAKKLPSGTRDWLLKSLSDSRGSLSVESLGGAVSRYFYLSTLGLNLSAATKNLLQPFITTLNVLGPRAVGLGATEVMGRMKVYNRLLLGKMKPAEAFAKAFPEFYAAMEEERGQITELLGSDLLKPQRGVAKVMKAVKTAMMAPFGGTETWNRLLTFYSAHRGLLDDAVKAGVIKNASSASPELLGKAAAFGRDMVLATQFPGGPLSMPSGILNIWGPFRQFAHFPLRYAGFLLGSTAYGVPAEEFYAGKLGALRQKLRLKPYPSYGVIGRALMGSTALYEAARNILGVDLSRGLMFGALPVPEYEQAPFFPFPMVPPVFNIAGALGQAAITQEWGKYMGPPASLMIPGGVAARRLYKTLSPKYAQYGKRTPDGKIPVYNRDGSLIATYTPLQLMLKAAGISPSDAAAESDMARWLIRQRDKIREFRRAYIEAMADNDLARADRIQRQFKQAYPQLGELQVKKSDLRAISNRREITRLARILKGMPADYQPLFSQVVGTTALAALSEEAENSAGMPMEMAGRT